MLIFSYHFFTDRRVPLRFATPFIPNFNKKNVKLLQLTINHCHLTNFLVFQGSARSMTVRSSYPGSASIQMILCIYSKVSIIRPGRSRLLELGKKIVLVV